MSGQGRKYRWSAKRAQFEIVQSFLGGHKEMKAFCLDQCFDGSERSILKCDAQRIAVAPAILKEAVSKIKKAQSESQHSWKESSSCIVRATASDLDARLL
jgi:hypothetical protein